MNALIFLTRRCQYRMLRNHMLRNRKFGAGGPNRKMKRFPRHYGILVWSSREPYSNEENKSNGGNEQKIEDKKPQTTWIVWYNSDGELRGIDFGVFQKCFLHPHTIFEFNEKDAGLLIQRTVNWQLIKKQLTQLVCFILVLSFLGWKLFALIFWKACVFYWVHHSPYPTRIRQVQYFLGEVGTLVKLVVMGSISFQASVKLFQVAFAQFIQEIKSKELLNPQALSFLQVLGLTIRSYSIAAGFPLLKTIYIPLFAMFGIGLWFDLRNHKFRIPIMISFSIILGIFIYAELERSAYFKRPIKPVDPPIRIPPRRPPFPYKKKRK